MPRIPVYNNTQTVDPQPLEQAAYRVERTGQIQGAAYRDLGGQLARVTSHAADEIEKHMATQETSDLSQKLSDLDLTVTQQYEDARKNGDVSDPNFVLNFVSKNIQPQLEKLGRGLVTTQGQEMFHTASLQMVSGFSKRGIADQAAFAGDKAVENYKNTVTQSSNMAALDPTTVDHAAGMMTTLSAALPAEHRQELLDIALSSIYASGAKGYIDTILKNPDATPETLDAAWAHISDPKAGFVDHIAPDTFSALQKQYEGAKETIGATRDEVAKIQWPKFMTAVREGDPDATAAAQQFADNYQGATPQETVVERTRLNSELQDASNFYKASSTYRDMPQTQIDAQYDTLKQHAQAGDKTAKAALQAIDTRQQEYRRDPSMYVLKNSEVVQTRYQQYAENPTPQTFAAFATTSMAEQRRLYPDAMPRLVTKDMEQSISQQIAGITKDPNGASKVADLLNQYSSVTGSFWPQVSSELSHDKILNSEQAVAASMWTKPEARGVAEELLRASVLPPKELEANSGVSTAKADKAAADALKDFRTALAPQTNGFDIYSNYVSSLSLLLRSRGTVDSGTASTLAAKLINDEYQFSGTLMIPADANVNLHDVVAGTKSVQADIIHHDIVVPPSYSGTGPADQKAEYMRDIQRSGYWVMSGDNKSAMLVSERGDPVYETIKGQKRPVAVPWDKLQQLGRQ